MSDTKAGATKLNMLIDDVSQVAYGQRALGSTLREKMIAVFVRPKRHITPN
jgi:hypothetical protein